MCLSDFEGGYVTLIRVSEIERNNSRANCAFQTAERERGEGSWLLFAEDELACESRQGGVEVEEEIQEETSRRLLLFLFLHKIELETNALTKEERERDTQGQ